MKKILTKDDAEYWHGRRFLSHYANMCKYKVFALMSKQQLQRVNRKYEGLSLERTFEIVLEKMPPEIRKQYEDLSKF